MQLFAYCLLPNHWHLVLSPSTDGSLSAYVHRISLLHSHHYQRDYRVVGQGHLYQGRFKSFLIQDARYLWNVLRYVDANALRAGLVTRAEHWPWSSASPNRDPTRPPLAEWPEGQPSDWLEWINVAVSDPELKSLRTAARRGRPYGDEDWVRETVKRHGLEWTVRKPGRPAKTEKGTGYLFASEKVPGSI